MKANVEDGENDVLEKRGTESHRQYVDFQYVVKGNERFGLLDHVTSKPKAPYRPDIINYNYDVSKTKFVDSTPTASSSSSLATGTSQKSRPTRKTRKYALW